MQRKPKSQELDSSASPSQLISPRGEQQDSGSVDLPRVRSTTEALKDQHSPKPHPHRRRRSHVRPGTQTLEHTQSSVGPVERNEFFGPIRVSAPVARALSELGYEAPTPIQLVVIEPLLAGKDIVGQAQTGTGKTAGFGIPISEKVDGRNKHVQVLILVPTRELARQVSMEIAKLSKYRGTTVLAVYGGTPLNPQIQAIEKGVNVVVGTPGRVIDLNDRGVLELGTVAMVVLDEADQMLDIGFLPAIRRILRSIPRTRQTALFTATVPTTIKRLIYSYLHDPDWFQVGEESEPVDQVVQRYCEAASRDKFAALLEILDRNIQTLVFRRTQGDVDWLVRTLKRSKFRVEAIHGGLPQRERDSVMQSFRDGDLKLLVSTNLTSRGIDVPAVANVINYDIPETVEEYVHRIGRTARMGRDGLAITFVSEWDLDFFDAIKAHIGDGLERLDLTLYK
jgi:ATP-dependent RNA helicase DeaD